MKKLLIAILAVLNCTNPVWAANNGSKYLPRVPKAFQGNWKRYDVDGWIAAITATTIWDGPGYAPCDIKKIKQIKDPNGNGTNCDANLAIYQIDELCYGEDPSSPEIGTSGLVKSLWALRKISSGDYVLVITYPNFNSIEVFQREN
jgi:hypothetical protein